jgi:hypothetical protein
MNLLKTVFHIHTDYSDDSNLSVETLTELARQQRVNCLAVTDHDTIQGAQRLAAIAGPDLQVIIGEEISTNQGHLIGLFLKEHIEPGHSPRRTADLIHQQGGLVIVPHPYNRLFGCGLRGAVDEMIDLADAVEVWNAQNIMDSVNHQAEQLAADRRRPSIVGTDIHHGHTLDACHQWIPPFDGPESFIESLRDGTFVKGRHPLTYFLETAWIILREKTGLGFPSPYGKNCPIDRREIHHEPITASD